LNRFRVVFSQSQLEQAGQITCNRSHAYYDLCSVDGPALLEPITAGGYTGNFFHDFSDGFVPLFITINSLFYNQDVTLVISDCNDPWWPQKYAEILSQFSHYPIIDIKKERITHCFPSAIIGLIKHGPMIVDPTLLPHHPKSLNDFRVFLENSYKKKGGDDVLITSYNRPQLVFVIRKLDVGRAILNKKEVVKAIEEVGFHVNVLDPTTTHTSLAKFTLAMQWPRAVLVQLVPIGVDLPSNISFKGPAKNLGLEYMEYKVKTKESSLVEIYGANDLVLKNPDAYSIHEDPKFEA
ncbi:hypothetical protein CFP56_006161, partial [Quercus suber]